MVTSSGKCKKCDSGKYQPLLDYRGESCTECENGKFADEIGAKSCKQWKTCEPPMIYAAENGNTTKDIVCRKCDMGKFTSKRNEAKCSIFWNRLCPPGQGYEEGRCVHCPQRPRGKYNTGNFLECKAHTTCKAGFEEGIPGDKYSDRLCIECPYGKFRNINVTGDKCKPWKKCINEKEMLETEGTTTTNRICKLKELTCPPGLYLNSETNKCKRCSIGRYSKIFDNIPRTQCNKTWTDCHSKNLTLLRFGSTTEDNTCASEGCIENEEYFNEGAGSCVTYQKCKYLREYMKMEGTATEDRQCETCPSVIMDFGVEVRFSLDGINCNVTEEDMCQRIYGYDCTYRRRIPLSQQDILDYLDVLTGIMVLSYLTIALNSLCCIFICLFKRRKKDKSKENAERDQYRLNKKKKFHSALKHHDTHNQLADHHAKSHRLLSMFGKHH